MAKGTLIVQTTTLDQILPVANAAVTVTDNNGNVVAAGRTDESGNSPIFTLSAPPAELTLDPAAGIAAYSTYNVDVSADGFTPVRINGVQIVNDNSILPVIMRPLPAGQRAGRAPVRPITYDIAPINAAMTTGAQLQAINTPAFASGTSAMEAEPAAVRGRALTSPYAMPTTRVAGPVCLPDKVRVHLGPPTDTTARTVTVSFSDYVKNVASSEIYSTWPKEALDANIIAIMNFTINRVYTEWYPSRGYNFDITNNTAYDQKFIEGRNIFQNISDRADALMGTYARKVGFQNPYFTEYCNGTTSTCDGLSQWGTVPQAEQGKAALQILQYYYGSDLELTRTNCTVGTGTSYPGTALTVGSTGDDVLRIQTFLNRIHADYPAIPLIVNPSGYYGTDTANAVRKFQEIFKVGYPDGIVGPATWNKITALYVGIIKLAELNGEAERVGLSPAPPTNTIRRGASGADVAHLQYILSVLAGYYDEIPLFIRDSDFGPATKNAVIAFQKMAGLTPDGVVGPATWRALYEYYRGLGDAVKPPATPPQTPGGDIPAYPGTPLREGSSGTLVRSIQVYLNDVGLDYPNIPHVEEDGVFGPATRRAVVAFQRQFGLSPDGIVGKLTWDKLVQQYLIESGGVGQQPVDPTKPNPIEPTNPNQPPVNPPANQYPAYPGTPLRQGSQGENVKTIQRALGLSPDGIFGSATRAAVISFQYAHGLVPDGIVGPLTWNALVRQ